MPTDLNNIVNQNESVLLPIKKNIYRQKHIPDEDFNVCVSSNKNHESRRETSKRTADIEDHIAKYLYQIIYPKGCRNYKRNFEIRWITMNSNRIPTNCTNKDIHKNVKRCKCNICKCNKCVCKPCKITNSKKEDQRVPEKSGNRCKCKICRCSKCNCKPCKIINSKKYDNQLTPEEGLKKNMYPITDINLNSILPSKNVIEEYKASNEIEIDGYMPKMYLNNNKYKQDTYKSNPSKDFKEQKSKTIKSPKQIKVKSKLDDKSIEVQLKPQSSLVSIHDKNKNETLIEIPKQVVQQKSLMKSIISIFEIFKNKNEAKLSKVTDKNTYLNTFKKEVEKNEQWKTKENLGICKCEKEIHKFVAKKERYSNTKVKPKLCKCKYNQEENNQTIFEKKIENDKMLEATQKLSICKCEKNIDKIAAMKDKYLKSKEKTKFCKCKHGIKESDRRTSEKETKKDGKPQTEEKLGICTCEKEMHKLIANKDKHSTKTKEQPKFCKCKYGEKISKTTFGPKAKQNEKLETKDKLGICNCEKVVHKLTSIKDKCSKIIVRPKLCKCKHGLGQINKPMLNKQDEKEKQPKTKDIRSICKCEKVKEGIDNLISHQTAKKDELLKASKKQKICRYLKEDINTPTSNKETKQEIILSKKNKMNNDKLTPYEEPKKDELRSPEILDLKINEEGNKSIRNHNKYGQTINKIKVACSCSDYLKKLMFKKMERKTVRARNQIKRADTPVLKPHVSSPNMSMTKSFELKEKVKSPAEKREVESKIKKKSYVSGDQISKGSISSLKNGQESSYEKSDQSSQPTGTIKIKNTGKVLVYSSEQKKDDNILEVKLDHNYCVINAKEVKKKIANLKQMRSKCTSKESNGSKEYVYVTNYERVLPASERKNNGPKENSKEITNIKKKNASVNIDITDSINNLQPEKKTHTVKPERFPKRSKRKNNKKVLSNETNSEDSSNSFELKDKHELISAKEINKPMHHTETEHDVYFKTNEAAIGEIDEINEKDNKNPPKDSDRDLYLKSSDRNSNFETCEENQHNDKLHKNQKVYKRSTHIINCVNSSNDYLKKLMFQKTVRKRNGARNQIEQIKTRNFNVNVISPEKSVTKTDRKRNGARNQIEQTKTRDFNVCVISPEKSVTKTDRKRNGARNQIEQTKTRDFNVSVISPEKSETKLSKLKEKVQPLSEQKEHLQAIEKKTYLGKDQVRKISQNNLKMCQECDDKTNASNRSVVIKRKNENITNPMTERKKHKNVLEIRLDPTLCVINAKEVERKIDMLKKRKVLASTFGKRKRIKMVRGDVDLKLIKSKVSRLCSRFLSTSQNWSAEQRKRIKHRINELKDSYSNDICNEKKCSKLINRHKQTKTHSRHTRNSNYFLSNKKNKTMQKPKEQKKTRKKRNVTRENRMEEKIRRKEIREREKRLELADKKVLKDKKRLQKQIKHLKKIKNDPIEEQDCRVVTGKLLFKCTIGLVQNIFKGIFSVIRNPKGSYVYVKDRALDPIGTTRRISEILPSALERSRLKIAREMSASEKMNIITDAVQDTALYRAINRGKTKKERRNIEAENRMRRRRIEKMNKAALGSCRYPFLHTLRRKPCLWVYHIAPSLYPQCLGLLKIIRTLWNMLAFLVALACWTPCIIATECMRGLCCCMFCNG